MIFGNIFVGLFLNNRCYVWFICGGLDMIVFLVWVVLVCGVCLIWDWFWEGYVNFCVCWFWWYLVLYCSMCCCVVEVIDCVEKSGLCCIGFWFGMCILVFWMLFYRMWVVSLLWVWICCFGWVWEIWFYWRWCFFWNRLLNLIRVWVW